MFGTAVASARGTRRLIGVEAHGMTACPCAQEMVTDRSRERLEADGFSDDEIERVFRAVPVATHNQRGIGRLYVGCPEGSTEGRRGEEPAADRRGVDELRDLRADEAQRRGRGGRARPPPAALRRGLRARDGAHGRRTSSTSFPDDAFILARQENLETIHRHNVVAERHGLLGELKRELGEEVHVPHHVTMREWLEDRTILG